jgi:hypothetical protein
MKKPLGASEHSRGKSCNGESNFFFFGNVANNILPTQLIYIKKKNQIKAFNSGRALTQ